MENKRILKFIAKMQLSALSEEEQRELDEWIASSPQNRQLYDEFVDEDDLADNEEELADASWKRFEKDYYSKVSLNKPERRWWRDPYVAAASILILLSVGRIVWAYYPFSAEQVAASAGKEEATPVAMSAIMNFPKIGDKAALILPGGLTVDVDSLQNGDSILVENNYVKKKSDGILEVQSGAGGHLKRNNKNDLKAELSYAFLNIPRKKRYQLVLSDGTTVWVNEFSSLRFPMKFDLNSRDVALAGEAYFEVKAVQNRTGKVPFIVNTKKMNVNVVGTRFNVNAYDTAFDVKTTLIEGKIEVVHKGAVKEMRPGEQAKLTQDGTLSIQKRGNPKEAWVNNLVFQDKPLQEILQQVGQLCNVQFSFECCELVQYTLKLSRDMTLSEMLEHMEGLGEFYFVAMGKKIIVKKGIVKKKNS